MNDRNVSSGDPDKLPDGGHVCVEAVNQHRDRLPNSQSINGLHSFPGECK